MSILIGNAAKDERGKYTGGTPGDQTGVEVYTRAWYNRPWNVVLRPKTQELALKLAHAMLTACGNDNLGYDYGTARIQLLNEARKVDFNLSKITTPCNCDCSSLVAVCCIAAGIKESDVMVSGRPFVTSEIEQKLKKTNQFEVLKDSKYLTSDAYLKVGDILLNTKCHVAIALGNGSSTNVPSTPRTLSKGCKGDDVKELQEKLIAAGYDCGSCGADGSFGNATDAAVRKFQKDNCLEVDGKVGPKTRECLNNFGKESYAEGKIAYKSVIANNGLNIRKGPGTNFEIITVLSKGTKVKVIEENVGWAKIEINGGIGYCSTSWIE